VTESTSHVELEIQRRIQAQRVRIAAAKQRAAEQRSGDEPGLDEDDDGGGLDDEEQQTKPQVCSLIADQADA
jgi:hypothetical protein